MSLDQLPWYERANLDIQEFSAAGIRTFAVVEGRKDAFPVIFLHGLPGGAFVWAAVIKALGRSRLSVAPDFPGWGKSFSRFGKAAPEMTAEGLRVWLNGLLSAQSIERFDLVAHGDGAWPAMDLLMQDPSRVRRLSLISAPLWETRAHPSMLERLLGMGKWSPKRIELWLGESAAISDGAREEHHTMFAQALGSGADVRTAPLLAEMEFPARIADYRSALAAYSGAKLLIWGRDDPAAPKDKISELTATLGADVHRITNAGHFPMLDAPGEVAALLKEFLGE